MPRFYLSEALHQGQIIDLPDNVVRHLHVLRIRPHEDIILFNGNGRAYPARLLALEKRRASAEILSEQTADNESALKITLVQAISGGDRMDFTLQKSVELGVTEIRPVLSERCVVRLSGERAEKRAARWQDIVIAACEQSGRNVVPKVLPVADYHTALAMLPPENTRLLMSLNRARRLKDVAPSPQGIVLMIGPEGGWTPQEEEQAFAAGFESITLGPRILRTETASLAAIAAMQTLWGDFT